MVRVSIVGFVMQFKRTTAAFIVACTFAVTVAGCGGSPAKQSTGERLDDSVLTAKVKTTSLTDAQVTGIAVNVDPFKGTVQLSGFVGTEAERVRAGELARIMNGVRHDLQVGGE